MSDVTAMFSFLRLQELIDVKVARRQELQLAIEALDRELAEAYLHLATIPSVVGAPVKACKFCQKPFTARSSCQQQCQSCQRAKHARHQRAYRKNKKEPLHVVEIPRRTGTDSRNGE